MDRRVKRTISSIEGGFVHLLKEYSIHEITVQQIADEADVNRATFYKYYQDKYDLLNEIENKEIERIKLNVDYHDLENKRISEMSDLDGIVDSIPYDVMKVVLDNIELYQVLFNMKRESLIEEKLSDTIVQNLSTVLHSEKNINGIPFRYFHTYVAGALISTIKFWVLDKDRVSKEELAQYLHLLVEQGPIKQLVQELSKRPESNFFNRN